MRNFDLHNRWLDNNGNILRGCVEVMVRDGNTKAPIYDSDGVAIDNPQLTDIYGRTDKQIFIDTDVVAYFYKYIGDGRFEDIEAEGIDTSDQTKWSLQYTAENQLKIGLTFTTDSPICVGSRSDLNDIDPEQVPTVGGVKMVEVLGYNEPGDTQPVRYIWNEDTDAWDMVPPAVHLDVRLFGVFPSSSQNNVENQRAGIMAAVQYANENGLRVWFPKTETNDGNNIEYKYYRYDNVYAVFGNGLDVDEGVIFLDSGTNSTFRFSDIHGDLYFQSAKTAVLANYAKASWNMRALSKNNDLEPATYIIDTMEMSTGVRSLTKWTVKCTTNPVYGFTFTSCDLGEDGSFGSAEIDEDLYANEFYYCKLTGKMFITSGQYEATLVNMAHNCEFDIQDFRHCPDLWRQLRCTDDANPYIDWQNIDNPGRPYTTYAGNKITSSNVVVLNHRASYSTRYSVDQISENQTNLEMHNCTGWYRISSTLSTQIKNSNVKLTIQANSAMQIEDSTVYLDDTTGWTNLPTLSFKNCTIVGTSGVEYNLAGLTLYNCIVSADFSAKIVVAKGSQINGTIRFISDSSVEGSSIYFDSNIVNGQLQMEGAASNSTITATITNNNGSSVTPVLVNRTYLDPVDAHHAYIYENNRGTMPKREVSFTENTTVIPNIQNFTGYEWFWTLASGQYGFHDPYIGFATYYYDDGQAYYRHHFRFQTQFSVFRIGTDEQEVAVDWRLNSNNASSAGYVTPNRFYAKIVHTSGESYILEGIWKGGAPTSPNSAQGENTAYFNAATAVQSLGTAIFNNTYTFKI
jgi:hypothetical protein